MIKSGIKSHLLCMSLIVDVVEFLMYMNCKVKKKAVQSRGNLSANLIFDMSNSKLAENFDLWNVFIRNK